MDTTKQRLPDTWLGTVLVDQNSSGFQRGPDLQGLTVLIQVCLSIHQMGFVLYVPVMDRG